jgi:hypothetical protein
MELTQVRDWLMQWLPFLQGFAALASVVGATLSWRFALKAKRAQSEMLNNAISSRFLATAERTLESLNSFRSKSVNEIGEIDKAAYRRAAEQNKVVIELALSEAVAARDFIRLRPDLWKALTEKLAEGAASPDHPLKIEYACKYLSMVTSEMKVGIASRQLLPNEA